MSETRTEATDDGSAQFLDKCLQLLRRDVALDVHYRFFDYTMCSKEGDKVKGSIAQTASLDAWIAKEVTFVTKRKKRGRCK